MIYLLSPPLLNLFLKNKTLDLIENQKLKVNLELKGSNLPNEVFIRIADRDFLMSKAESSDFLFLRVLQYQRVIHL